MMLTQASRRAICRFLIGVLVSTQLAVAAYACSGTARVAQLEQVQPGNAAVAMVDHNGAGPIASYPGAAANQGAMGYGGLDPALPNLCAAHYQYGQQSADHTPAPAVPAALLTSLYMLAPLGDSSGYVGSHTGPTGLLAVADPPHAVLHCCLRT
ncbi:MAG: hypothetical protein EPN64_18155 [Burkholderiaceae bacterium]|nr:MAG: hypothetical protein EPN64_18155 [Burkholderiaceae bacterium]